MANDDISVASYSSARTVKTSNVIAASKKKKKEKANAPRKAVMASESYESSVAGMGFEKDSTLTIVRVVEIFVKLQNTDLDDYETWDRHFFRFGHFVGVLPPDVRAPFVQQLSNLIDHRERLISLEHQNAEKEEKIKRLKDRNGWLKDRNGWLEERVEDLNTRLSEAEKKSDRDQAEMHEKLREVNVRVNRSSKRALESMKRDNQIIPSANKKARTASSPDNVSRNGSSSSSSDSNRTAVSPLREACYDSDNPVAWAAGGGKQLPVDLVMAIGNDSGDQVSSLGESPPVGSRAAGQEGNSCGVSSTVEEYSSSDNDGNLDA